MTAPARPAQNIVNQRFISQRRAEAAWGKVNTASTKRYADKYYQAAKSAASDVQSNGLGQMLAFWKAKGSKEQHFKDLIQDLSSWLQVQPGIQHKDETLGWIMQNASTSQYRRATAEAIAFLIWLKRFAEANQVD